MIVPDGVYAGDALIVRSPDGKQVTQAVVPNGHGPGQSFTVTFPTYSPEVINLEDDDAPQAGCVHDIDRFFTPIPSIPEVWGTFIVNENDIVVEESRRALDTINLDDDSIREASPEGNPTTKNLEPEEERNGGNQEPTATNSLVKLMSKALLLEDGDDDEDEDAFKDLAQTPSAVTAPPRLSNKKTKKNKEIKEDASEQKMLVVRVPVGVQPGSTIYVEIPGENRTVAAMVPEGVQSFQVCYTPRPMPLLAPPEKRLRAPRPEQKLQLPLSQVQQRSYQPFSETRNVPTTTAAIPTTSSPSGQQKLLLVRVPPGTRAGTTIHVSVPDEPGRILAAVVPAGDVREFHVSYESRIIPVDAPPTSSFLPPASPYRNHSMGDSGLGNSTGADLSQPYEY